MKNYLLGMDCGTTNIKAIIMGEDGEIAAEASRPSKFLTPGAFMHEQDANEWWKNAVDIFSSLSYQAGKDIVHNIRGISISSHTVTMLPLDKDGNPLRNALTYQDGRSAKELEEILSRIGYESFVKIVGGQPAVSFLPNKILWFKNHEPELFEKTSCFIQASSYLNYRLTGVLSLDMDQAARTQCMDVETMEWSEEIGKAVGIEFGHYFPKVYPVDEIIGSVTKEAAALTGLSPGIPVIAGCSDAMASMYATGMSQLKDAGESCGTSSLVFVGSDRKSVPDVPVVTKPCFIEGMPYVFDAPITTSGAAIKWYIDTFAAEEKNHAKKHQIGIYDYLNQLALEAEPGSDGIIFYPYLLGERAPLWNDHARGMFIGMGMDTKRSSLIRSVFEGTAFALRHVMETARASGGRAESLRICGGGAKSHTWAKIKASMLHMPVKLLNDKAGDVPLGDALLVGHKVGVFKDLSKAVEEIVKVDKVIWPDEEWAEVYDRLYPYYIKMYQHLDGDLKQLHETMKYIRKS